MMTPLAAAGTQQDPGWGKLVALILAAGLFWLLTAAHKRWKEVKDLPSPKTEPKAISTVTPALTAESDPTPAAPTGGGEVVPLGAADDARLRDYLDGKVGSQPTTALVRMAVADLGVSDSAVWRALRRMRAESGAA